MFLLHFAGTLLASVALVDANELQSLLLAPVEGLRTRSSLIAEVPQQ